MNEPITISNETPALTGMDFLALRQQGIELIQRLSGNVWTDYNLHDPGITILEQLCYAITDLSYRLSFDIQDLLAYNDKQASTGSQQFFSAREILSTHPVTLLDYRKLLIDIDGVKNAWLELDPQPFTDLYYDQQMYKLAFNPTQDRTMIALTGLYRVIIEQDDDVSEQDKSNLLQIVKDKLHAHRNLAEDFSSIEILPAENITLKAEIDIDEAADADTVRASIYAALSQFISPSIRFYSLQERLQAGLMPEDIFSGPSLSHGFIDDAELSNFDKRTVLYKSDMYNLLLDVAGVTAVKNLVLESDKSIAEQQGWILKLDVDSTPKYNVSAIIKNDEINGKEKSDIKLYKKQIAIDINADKVRQHYNKLTTDEIVTIKAEIKIRKNADPHYVLAKVYRVLQYLISRYSVVSANKKLGFIEYPVLSKNLISNLLLKLRDIRSVKITAIGSNKSLEGEQLILNEKNIPKFKLPGIFFTEGDISLYQAGEQITQLEQAKFEAEVLRLVRYSNTDSQALGYDLPALRGDYRELSDYISVQNDFPSNYGIGQASLSEMVDEKRKGQVKQLKAYLMIFDQLLANYFAQLEATKHLLAVKPGQLADLNRTYFAQPVDGIMGAAEILQVQDEQAVLAQLTESVENEERFQRKSRLLDHLLARFAEEFPDNKLLMYTDMANYNAIKQNYLSDYAATSSKRFMAYNYLSQAPVWNSNNIAGLQRRISGLMGIKNAKRQVLSLGYEEGFHLVEHILLRPVDEARLARWPRKITKFKSSTLVDDQLICYSVQHGLKDGEKIELILAEQDRQIVSVIMDNIEANDGVLVETSANAFKVELVDEDLRAKLLAAELSDDYRWDYSARVGKSISEFKPSSESAKHVICYCPQHGLQSDDEIQILLPDASPTLIFPVIMDESNDELEPTAAETSADKFKILVEDDTVRAELLTVDISQGYGWDLAANGKQGKFPRLINRIQVRRVINDFIPSAVHEQLICWSPAHGLNNGERINLMLADQRILARLEVVMDLDESVAETGSDYFKVVITDAALIDELLAADMSQLYHWSYDNSAYLVCETMIEHELQVGDKIRLTAEDYQTELAVVEILSPIQFVLRAGSALEVAMLTSAHLKPVDWEWIDAFLDFTQVIKEITPPVIMADDDQSVRVNIGVAENHHLYAGSRIAIFDGLAIYREYEVSRVVNEKSFTLIETDGKSPLVYRMPLGTVFYWAALTVQSHVISAIECPDKDPIDVKPVEITFTTDVQELQVDMQVAIYTSHIPYRLYMVRRLDLQASTFTVEETDPGSPLLQENLSDSSWQWAHAQDFMTQLEIQAYKRIDTISPAVRLPEEDNPVQVTLSTQGEQIQVNDEIVIFGNDTPVTKYKVSAVTQGSFTVEETDSASSLLQGNSVGLELNWAFARTIYEPYSFQISLVFPAWLPRFADTEFRQLLTETILRETPAHIAVNVHWFNRKQMNEFEQVYNDWLLRKSNQNATAGDIDTAANKVLSALYQGKPVRQFDESTFGAISQMMINKDFRISYAQVEEVITPELVGGIGHMRIRQGGTDESNTQQQHKIFQILFPDD